MRVKSVRTRKIVDKRRAAQKKANPAPRHRFNWLPIEVTIAAEPFAERLHVSAVARGEVDGAGGPPGWPKSFMPAYRQANGQWRQLPLYWQRRRNAFVARHRAQGVEEGWWMKTETGWEPTRRHLALVMWAYSPTPRRLCHWLMAMTRRRSESTGQSQRKP